MSKLPSYPKIFNLGHDAIDKLFDGEVEITEKVDGSQFRFGIDSTDELLFGSKGVQLYNKEQNNMFCIAVEQVEKRHDVLIDLRKEQVRLTGNPGIELYFYGEYLNKNKHNCLKYARMPKDNIILFSVKVGENFVDDYDKVKYFADKLQLEQVPLLFKGVIDNDRVIKSESGNVNQRKKFGYTRYEKLKAMINGTVSILGDSIIEGVVIKNYKQFHCFTGDPKPCFGKYVREDFKEKLHKEWPSISGKNALQEFIDGFKSEARWRKAVQHLRDRGELENSPKDIGKLMKEIHTDIAEEESENIKKFLYNYFLKDIKRRAARGFPEWYKDLLMKKQCE